MDRWQLYCTKPEYEYGLEDFYAAHGLTFDMIEAKDNPRFDLVGTVWPKVLQRLWQWQQEGKTILVNCKVGHNRSACLVACWLATQEKMTLAQALQHLLNVRGTVLSNHSFRLQLV